MMTAERLWSRAITYALTRLFGMPVAVRGAVLQSAMPEDCPALVREGMLFVLIDGPIGYGVGLVDHALVAGLIEQQTLGRVGKRPVPPRAPTMTDAAMITEPLDRIFRMHEGMAAELPGPRPVSGYRYATRIIEAREFALHLKDACHDHWQIDIALGEGDARRGTLHLVLPREVKTEPSVEPVPDGWSRMIETRILGSELVMSAELGRLTLPAADVCQLKAGDTLTLPRAVIGKVTLIGASGTQVLAGRLGQSAGRKAIRVESPDPAAAFVAVGPEE